MKVEVELPDIPGNMEYVSKPVSAMWSSTAHCGGLRREHRVEVELAVVEKKPPYPAPEGYEFTGEHRVPASGEFYLTDASFVATGPGKPYCCGVMLKPMWILRKKKPTYTEAVKTAGWKWPTCLNPAIRYITVEENWVRGHYNPPHFNGDAWRETGSDDDGDFDVDFAYPPDLDGYEWHETLLCRDDFL